MTKGKNKKIKIRKTDLFIFTATPFLTGQGIASVNIWVSGQRVDNLTEWQSQQKRQEGKSQWKEGYNNPSPS